MSFPKGIGCSGTKTAQLRRHEGSRWRSTCRLAATDEFYLGHRPPEVGTQDGWFFLAGVAENQPEQKSPTPSRDQAGSQAVQVHASTTELEG